MAYIKINSNYTPISFDEMIKPYNMYKEGYEKQLKEYETYQDSWNLIGTMLDPELDKEAYGEWQTAMNDLDRYTSELQNGMTLNTKKGLFELSKRKKDLLDITVGATKKNEAIKEYDKLNKTGRYIGIDPRTKSVEEWRKGKNPVIQGVSGDLVQQYVKNGIDAICKTINKQYEQQGFLINLIGVDYNTSQKVLAALSQNLANGSDQPIFQQGTALNDYMNNLVNQFQNVVNEAVSIYDPDGEIQKNPELKNRLYNEIFNGVTLGIGDSYKKTMLNIPNLYDKENYLSKKSLPKPTQKQLEEYAKLKDEYAEILKVYVENNGNIDGTIINYVYNILNDSNCEILNEYFPEFNTLYDKANKTFSANISSKRFGGYLNHSFDDGGLMLEYEVEQPEYYQLKQPEYYAQQEIPPSTNTSLPNLLLLMQDLWLQHGLWLQRSYDLYLEKKLMEMDERIRKNIEERENIIFDENNKKQELQNKKLSTNTYYTPSFESHNVSNEVVSKILEDIGMTVTLDRQYGETDYEENMIESTRDLERKLYDFVKNIKPSIDKSVDITPYWLESSYADEAVPYLYNVLFRNEDNEELLLFAKYIIGENKYDIVREKVSKQMLDLTKYYNEHNRKTVSPWHDVVEIDRDISLAARKLSDAAVRIDDFNKKTNYYNENENYFKNNSTNRQLKGIYLDDLTSNDIEQLKQISNFDNLPKAKILGNEDIELYKRMNSDKEHVLNASYWVNRDFITDKSEVRLVDIDSKGAKSYKMLKPKAAKDIKDALTNYDEKIFKEKYKINNINITSASAGQKGYEIELQAPDEKPKTYFVSLDEEELRKFPSMIGMFNLVEMCLAFKKEIQKKQEHTNPYANYAINEEGKLVLVPTNEDKLKEFYNEIIYYKQYAKNEIANKFNESNLPIRTNAKTEIE